MAKPTIDTRSAHNASGNGVFCTLPDLYREGLKSGKNHLHLRRKALTSRGGLTRSTIRGRGMEFFESRPYVVEDEVRHIDWKVSARLNGVYTKIFIEEKDRSVYFVVDLRCHMFFGSRRCFKSVLAANIAARLSYAAINGGDRVGGFIFTNDAHKEIPTKSTKKGLAQLFGALAEKTGDIEQNDDHFRKDIWPAIFAQTLQRIHKGSAVFLVSDFYGLDDKCRDFLFALRKKADVLALKVCDPLDKELLPIGPVGAIFADKKVNFNSDDPVLRESYTRRYQAQSRFEDDLFTSLNIPKFNFSTAEDLDLSLKPLFAGIW